MKLEKKLVFFHMEVISYTTDFWCYSKLPNLLKLKDFFSGKMFLQKMCKFSNKENFRPRVFHSSYWLGIYMQIYDSGNNLLYFFKGKPLDEFCCSLADFMVMFQPTCVFFSCQSEHFEILGNVLVF